MNMMIVQQAVDDASQSMYGQVQPAVEAIHAAIEKVQPLLDHGTWSGSAAQEWIDGWMAQYKTVLNLLAEMPGIERQVVSAAMTRADHLARNMSHGSN